MEKRDFPIYLEIHAIILVNTNNSPFQKNLSFISSKSVTM